VDVDGDPSTVDPLTITDGNMQIHVSSCEDPPTSAQGSGIGSRETVLQSSRESGAAVVHFYADREGLALELPRAAEVTVRVYDILGRERAMLADGPRAPGAHRFALRGNGGGSLPNGIYFARAELRMGGATQVRTTRVALIK
jgi:hypothetical protein